MKNNGTSSLAVKKQLRMLPGHLAVGRRKSCVGRRSSLPRAFTRKTT